MHKMYLKQIDFTKHKEDLIEIIDMLMYDVKENNHDFYCHVEEELYELAYGKVLTEERAKEIVKDMRPYGMHWTMEQTKQVQMQKGLQAMKDIDFFIVMNSAYNDYHDLFDEDLEKYVLFTKKFIHDEDAKSDKVYMYFTTIPSKD